MKKGHFIGLFALCVVCLLILPVSADDCSVISASVIDCSHDVQISWTAWGEDDIVNPTIYYTVDRQECGSVTWEYVGVWAASDPLPVIDQNLAEGCYTYLVMPLYQGPPGYLYSKCVSSPSAPVTVKDTCVNTPEFPSAFLPLTMIIGFLGTVLYIQSVRQH